MSILFGIREIKEVIGTKEANEMLKQKDWKLLETITNPNGMTYIIGRLELRKI